jgi:hypothetical protein
VTAQMVDLLGIVITVCCFALAFALIWVLDRA